jgi:hypothetical protein
MKQWKQQEKFKMKQEIKVLYIVLQKKKTRTFQSVPFCCAPAWRWRADDCCECAG